MKYIVIDELKIVDGRYEIPVNDAGQSFAFDDIDSAADHFVWLEKEPLRRLRMYRLDPQIAGGPLSQARKRAKFAESLVGPVSRFVR